MRCRPERGMSDRLPAWEAHDVAGNISACIPCWHPGGHSTCMRVGASLMGPLAAEECNQGFSMPGGSSSPSKKRFLCSSCLMLLVPSSLIPVSQSWPSPRRSELLSSELVPEPCHSRVVGGLYLYLYECHMRASGQLPNAPCLSIIRRALVLMTYKCFCCRVWCHHHVCNPVPHSLA